MVEAIFIQMGLWIPCFFGITFKNLAISRYMLFFHLGNVNSFSNLKGQLIDPLVGIQSSS